MAGFSAKGWFFCQWRMAGFSAKGQWLMAAFQRRGKKNQNDYRAGAGFPGKDWARKRGRCRGPYKNTARR